MAAMSTDPVPAGLAPAVPAGEEKTEAIAPTVIFEDTSRAPKPIRDPKSASLIFKPSGQGCFP
ncbi:MAG: hypothetical protein K0Q91_1199 [Fibrobacteria bacterium]|jgi:hypothetical protein|nr:hypothetical protein [Fibrobacteria bacterium]